ncbi:hypothetical protein Afil01_38220 [Actinorhabdospora filicis]|uniref:DUF308 domain-containing protein n=1 Tax=Actinorhabdospora filicis TaxID=1785913 RepID=A0A9W6SL72_9ACTN|nr:hypothetical protein [Actinorhabdospora filicis]GLZ79015.1 hypothetical protein Afil01_38220 [Actinorhabdospora filicis]
MTERPEDEPERPDGLTEEQLTGDNLERRFSELIAGLDSPKWPGEEDEADDEPPAKPAAAKPAEPTLLELWDADLPESPEEAAETYEPPPPPPVPKPSRPAIIGLLLIVVGVVVFVRPSLLDVLGFGYEAAILLGAGVVLSGVAVLIWRLRPGDEDDPYDPEDGAVV